MPELPEVETMCRGIEPIVGLEIIEVKRPKCNYRPISITPGIRAIRTRLEGKRVDRVSRLGKRVLIHADEQALILQPKMTGMVSLENPPDTSHLRLQIKLKAKSKRGSLKSSPSSLTLLFWDRRGLGTVELLRESEIETRLITGRLGPDALDIEFEDFSERLSSTKREIKVALLDQKLVAGVGNLYASEMLHVSKIDPRARCQDISSRKKRLLHQTMQDILLTAIEHEGSTLSDGTYRNALNDPGSYQNQHLVYDRADAPCPTCSRGKIERIVQAQRSTFFCPKCQKA